MSLFQRKGTVSKSSGPVHVNSYALQGVPIKYTPPFFLPDQLTLPPSWTPPVPLSDDLFRYDYFRERQVLEQARVRTMSMAAEAQAKEKRDEEEENRRRIEAAAAAERAKLVSSSTVLPPPLIPSILTPTPAPHTITNAPLTNGVEVNTDTATKAIVSDSASVLKPLGEMSLSEFEGENFNPFDAASLQAINDMEILQTISLMPIHEATDSPPPPNTGSAQVSSSHSNSVTNQGQNVVTDSRPPATVAANIPGNVLPNSGNVNGPLVQRIPLQFSGPQPLSPIGTPPQSTLPLPSVTSVNGPSVPDGGPHQLTHPPSHPMSAPGVQQTHSAHPTLPILPPVGTNITHSHSEPTNANTPTPYPSQGPNPPSSTQPPPTNPNPLQSTLPTYPPRPQGTISPPTVTPPPTFNPPTLPPTSSSSSSPVIVSSAAPVIQPIPVPRKHFTPYPTHPQPPNMPTQQLPQPGHPTLGSSPSGPFLPPQPAAVGQGASSAGGGDVGTLVHLGGEVPAPLAVSTTTQQVTPTQTPPVPKPRTASQQRPNSAHLPYPTGSSPLPCPPAVAPKPLTRNSVKARANSLLATLPQGQPAISRPGLGVPVLPPISSANPLQPASGRGHSTPSLTPTSSAFTPPTHPPPTFPTPYLPSPSVLPPYPQPPAGRSSSPPPPYYSSQSQDPTIRRFSQPVPLRPAPSHYTLPDPQSSLSAEEGREVESIASMGFPAPRVARAVKRFNGDRTKVLDFLILVGGVEESSGSRGDSAETALTVCSDNAVKAKRYLQKVKYYRESGFIEKSIHDAYVEAGRDWDIALDVLTQHITV